MKKGLLSILAGALVVVGCQNYDDQFNNLESQINALASTVAGLSQVQSDLASLSGTVASLASTVNGLGSQIDTAVSNGLADIQADIDEIEAAVADVASGEAVDALTDAVTDAQADLDELLANSSIFNDNVTITDQNTLDVYHAMGSTLAIVNGNVSFDVSSDMDMTKVQEVADQILNVTGSYTYTAGTGVDTEVTFSNLAGTATLTIDQKGGYMLENLTSATVVTLTDDSTADVVHLGSLTTVTSLSDGSAAGTFEFDKANELHLTSLPRYNGSSLSLKVKKGGVIAMPALKDVDADGDAKVLDLTIDGPASIEMSNFTGDKAGSDLTLKNIVSAIVNGYDGNVIIGADVENFTSDNLVSWNTDNAADLVSVNITGALDPNSTTADTEGPDVALSSKGDLETVTVAGTVNKVSLSSNGNLASVTISGSVTGADGINIDGNSDLTSVTLTGAKTDKVVLNNNSDLEALTVDYTSTAASTAGVAATQEGHIKVSSNESLATLTISTDKVDNLEIIGNSDLETIDLSGMTAIGATGTASVSISGNALSASESRDTADGATTSDNVADGATGDLGSFTTASGMDTASAYLTAVAADADSAANVVFDTIDSVIDAEGTSESEESASGTNLQVLVLTAKVVTTASAVSQQHKLAWGKVLNDTGVGITLPDGAQLLTNSSGSAISALVLSGNETLAISEIKTSAALTRAAAYGLTLDAYSGYSPTGKITFQATVDSTTAEYDLNPDENSSNFTLSEGDYLNLTIDGELLSTTFSSTTGEDHEDSVVDILVAAWATKYGTTGTASYSESLFVISDDGASGNVIGIWAKDGSGSRGYDKSYSFSVVAATTTTTPTVGLTYGETEDSSDNKTTSGGIVVSLESIAAGTILDDVAGTTGTGFSDTLSTTMLVNGNVDTTTTKNIFPDDARGDVNLPEADIDEVATPATSFNRVGWLG